MFYLAVLLFQVYKVMVSVRGHEWSVFRRYAEFDKLYNTVSGTLACDWFSKILIRLRMNSLWLQFEL